MVVDFQWELTRAGDKFPLGSDPCSDLFPGFGVGGLWSDRHGFTECNPAPAFPRLKADPGDGAAHRTVAQHDPQVPAVRHCKPKFKVPDRASKPAPYADKPTPRLQIEAGRSRKRRGTVRQMHADLVALGFDGSHGRVAAFARKWEAERQHEQQTGGRGTFVPPVFAHGEAFRFDRSEDRVIPGGERVKLQVAHTRLSHSRAFIVRAYLLRPHEILFDAPIRALRAACPGAGCSTI